MTSQSGVFCFMLGFVPHPQPTGLVVGGPADGAAVARGHIADGIAEVTHSIGGGEGMGAGCVLRGEKWVIGCLCEWLR